MVTKMTKSSLFESILGGVQQQSKLGVQNVSKMVQKEGQNGLGTSNLTSNQPRKGPKRSKSGQKGVKRAIGSPEGRKKRGGGRLKKYPVRIKHFRL